MHKGANYPLGFLGRPFYSRLLAAILPRTIPRRIAQGCIGSSLCFFGLQSLQREISPCFVPTYAVLQAFFLNARRGFLTEIPSRLLKLAPHASPMKSESLRFSFCAFQRRRSEAFARSCWAWGQDPPLEQRFRHHTNSPAAEIIPFFVPGAGLGHLHESCFLEQANSPLTPSLAYARVPQDGAHVAVNEAAGRRRDAQAYGSKALRWLRIVSCTIWQASRRSDRVWRFGCDSKGHFLG